MAPETFERVRESVAKYLEIPADSVQPDSKLADLGLDSLGALELIFELEETYNIDVPTEQAKEFTTIRGVCDGIEAIQRAASTPAS
jgi:acyl carrier protein